MDEETRRQKVGGWIAILAVTLPGMLAGGFMPAWNVLPIAGWVAVAALGAAIGGVLWDEDHPIVGAISGVVLGAGGVSGVPLYVAVRSALGSTFLDLEIVLAVGLGALPGIALYAALSWMVAGRTVAKPADL